MNKKVLVLAVSAMLALSACGGSSGTSTPPVVPPSGLSYSSPQTLYVGRAIQELTPTVTGAVASYSVFPALPAGVVLNPNTGLISGLPTAEAAQAVYTVTARNSAGETTFGLSLTVVRPVATVLSGSIARTVVQGTSISVTVSIQTNFPASGTLYAQASDPTNLFLGDVTLTPGTGGAYAAELTTSASAAGGVHAASLTVNLCQDASCHTPAMVPSFAVPFSVNVMAAGDAWPGDHLTTLIPWTGVPDWSSYQGNAAHTGHVPATVDPDRFSTRWWRAAAQPYPTTGLATYAWYTMMNMVVTSGGLFFDAEGMDLIASREHDGSVVWRFSVSDLTYPSTNPPAVADNVVYMAAGNQTSTSFYAVDALTGALKFQAPAESQWGHYLAPAITSDGVFTEGGYYGGLDRFDAAGDRLYSVHEGLTGVWSPAVDSAGVYTFTEGYFTVNDPVTGAEVLSIRDPTAASTGLLGGSVVLGAPGSAFVANYPNARLGPGWFPNTMMNVDLSAGLTRWQVSGEYSVTPAYRAGVLYAPTINPVRLEARSETTGSLLWTWTPPLAEETKFPTEILVTDNLAFLCTNLALYAIDLNTHKTVWSYPIVGRMSLSAQGVLYVAGPTTLTAFNVK